MLATMSLWQPPSTGWAGEIPGSKQNLANTEGWKDNPYWGDNSYSTMVQAMEDVENPVPKGDITNGGDSSPAASRDELCKAIALAILYMLATFQQNADSMKDYLKDWQNGLMQQEKKVDGACSEATLAAWFSLASSLLSAFGSLAMGGLQVGMTAKSATNYKQAFNNEAPHRTEVATAKQVLKLAEGTDQASQAAEYLQQTRVELSEAAAANKILNNKGDTCSRLADATRPANQALDGLVRGPGEFLSNDRQVKRKKLDLEAEVADKKAQQAMENVRRRTADAAEARKSVDAGRQTVLAMDKARLEAMPR